MLSLNVSQKQIRAYFKIIANQLVAHNDFTKWNTLCATSWFAIILTLTILHVDKNENIVHI